MMSVSSSEYNKDNAEREVSYNIPQLHIRSQEIKTNLSTMTFGVAKKQSFPDGSLPSLMVVSTSSYASGPTFSFGEFENGSVSLNSSLSDLQTSFYQKSWEDLLVVSLYGTLFLVGVIGNVSVIVTICRRGAAGQPYSHRHALTLSLAVADLLICLLCYPFNVTPALMPLLKVSFPICNILMTIQSILHASSTFSMAFLAFDRYTIVKKPKMAPKVAKWLPHLIGALWSCSIIISLPMGLMVPMESYLDPRCSISLVERPLRELSLIYICSTTFFIYIMPCIIVCYCHLNVAYSLRRRGMEETELQEKPRHVIIVARDHSALAGNTTHKIVEATSSMESSKSRYLPPKPIAKAKKLKTHMKSMRIPSHQANSSVIQPSRSINTIVRAHRRLRVKQNVQSSPFMFADHRSHSVETRMQLAKFLAILVMIFAGCWLPYACALTVSPFVAEKRKMDIAIKFCLLLGHVHSAISPIVYWIMNRSILTSVHRLVLSYLHWPTSPDQPFCAICPRPKCLRPIQTQWGNNSSTNEDALGPFHPKYINPIAFKPPPSRHTSHYFR